MMRALLLVAGATSLVLGVGGCLVDSQCHADYDCTSPERCNGRTGQCAIECMTALDCWSSGVDNGKQCVSNRCEFRFDERVAALPFCLPIVNPASGRAGQQQCLADLKGKVVILYFGWIT
jgi:hypothetical protein